MLDGRLPTAADEEPSAYDGYLGNRPTTCLGKSRARAEQIVEGRNHLFRVIRFVEEAAARYRPMPGE